MAARGAPAGGCYGCQTWSWPGRWTRTRAPAPRQACPLTAALARRRRARRADRHRRLTLCKLALLPAHDLKTESAKQPLQSNLASPAMELHRELRDNNTSSFAESCIRELRTHRQRVARAGRGRRARASGSTSGLMRISTRAVFPAASAAAAMLSRSNSESTLMSTPCSTASRNSHGSLPLPLNTVLRARSLAVHAPSDRV